MAPQQRLDQIRDLANQWEQIAGYSFVIPDWMIGNMADDPKNIVSLYDFGQYMTGQIMANTVQGQRPVDTMPWIFWGMSSTEYNRKLEEYDSGFRALTGQAAPQDLITRALQEHQGTMTMGQFETWVTTQESLRNQYGWLKFGLDFQQFQTQKLQMRTQFGRDLSDTEAASLLQYHHAAQGGNVGVAAQQTLGQAEKKQAQTGISGSVVR